ncbi:MAG: DUF1343 domain-containing protein [Chitinophagales bacterium]
MRIAIITTLILGISIACKNTHSASQKGAIDADGAELAIGAGFDPSDSDLYDTDIIPAALRTELYFPLLRDAHIALVVNQSSLLGNTHLVDTLLAAGIYIEKIFAPEHGFRGTEDAGATVQNTKDVKTGIPVMSLYGNKKKPDARDLADVDVIVFDIQDVGVRFYTYISTLHYIMEACAENNKKCIVLDRPNPNGFYVGGPMLRSEFASFVGMDPVPVVYGMTIGEYAQMLNGEKYLTGGAQCDLEVIPCAAYTHASYYELPVAPSPNLQTMRSIYLYPSLCFFEGCNVSVGRGTDAPFEIYGSPYLPKGDFSFTPQSGPGAKSPPFMQQKCNGVDLRKKDIASIRKEGLQLDYILDAYARFSAEKEFF